MLPEIVNERELKVTQNAERQGRKSHFTSQNRQAKILHKKTHTLTKIAMNFVQEQLDKNIILKYSREQEL